MQGQRAGEGRAAGEELFFARHLAGGRPRPWARRRRAVVNAASVSLGPARPAIPPGPPSGDQGREPYGQTAGSEAALAADHTPKYTGKIRATRYGNAVRPAPARGGRPAASSPEVSPRRRWPAEVQVPPPGCDGQANARPSLPRLGQPSSVGPVGSRFGTHLFGDDLVEFAEDIFNLMEAVAPPFLLGRMERGDELCPRRLGAATDPRPCERFRRRRESGPKPQLRPRTAQDREAGSHRPCVEYRAKAGGRKGFRRPGAVGALSPIESEFASIEEGEAYDA